jgi:hypothetical protein
VGVIVPGTSLSDRYIVRALISTSGTTEVYRAEDRTADRLVAIKVLVSDHWYENARKRFQREAQAYAQLKHDGVIEIVDTGETSDGLPYLVLEYVQGLTLQERLFRSAKLSLDEVGQLGQRLAAALDAVHAHGMVHGDVKPGNIYLPDGDVRRAKLGDFGLVESLVRESSTNPRVFAGTPNYMSPEQVLGDRRSAASDVWSLGVVLYECAYGRLPFRRGGGMSGLLVQILESQAEFAPLDGGLDRVLARALAKQPAERFASMEAFAKALAATSVASRPRRFRVALVVLLIAIVLAVVFGTTLRDGGLLFWGVAIVLASSLLAAAFTSWLLRTLERRGQQRTASLAENAAQLRQKANTTDTLTRSFALNVEQILGGSAVDAAIDLRKVSLALAIEDYQLAAGREDQRQALNRAIELADKLQDQLQQRSLPWYARHKDALTVSAALLAAAAALVSGIAGAWK